MVRVHVLGGLDVETDVGRVDLPAGRACSLLAWLALNPGTHPRGALAERFWPGVPESSARASLRTALWSLRRALGPAGEAALLTRREGVELAGEPGVWVDVRAADALAAAGRLEEAALLLDGQLLPELDDDWVDEERERGRATLARLLERLVTSAQQEGDRERATRHALRRAAVDPLSESAHRDVLRLLAAGGDRASALREHERFVTRLRAELGLAPSEETRQVARDVAAHATRDPTFPPRLERHERAPFVGRDAELARLRAVWTRTAAAGPPALALLVGEPGIGKTRLAARLARLVHDDGAAVAYGAATEGGLAPLQPFSESMGEGLTAAIEPTGGGASAHRLFATAGDALRGLAGGSPLLLVLDDLQWADETSLSLLKYVLRSLEGVRGLVLATHRHIDADTPLGRALGDLLRDVRIERISLGGLAEKEIARLVRSRRADVEPEQLHSRTAGNPLFVELLLRQLEDEGGGGGDVPASVQEVVALRLQALGAECRRVLVLAAVLGEAFRLEPLALVADRSAGELADTLEEACKAGIVVEEPTARLAYRFAHTLLRDSLYGDLTRARRAALHCAAADALDALVEEGPDVLELARHRLEAVPLGSVDDALPAVDRAAAWAEARGAWEQAVELYGRALALLPAEDPRRRRLGVSRAIAYQALTHAVVDAASAPVLSRPG